MLLGGLRKKNGGSLGVSYWDDMMNNVRIEPPTESPKNLEVYKPE